METNDHEHYISFPLDNAHEGLQDNISHEEICEPVEECTIEEVEEEEVTEVTIADDDQDLSAAQVVEIITEQSDDEDQNSAVYPTTTIYINEADAAKTFTTGDESMAVEALRQLGGMCPDFEDKKVTCSKCSTVLMQSDLAKHETSCSLHKFTCPTCKEKFDKKVEYNNHMVCHQVERPYACRTCGNLFRSRANLQKHMAEVHNVERPHKCTVCGADFQRPSSLSNHMKIHNYVAGRALIQNQANNQGAEAVKNISDPQETAPVITAVESIESMELPEGQWAVQTYNISDQDNMEGLENQTDKIDTIQEFTVLPNGEIAHFEYTSGSNDITQEYTLNLNPLNNAEGVVKVKSVRVKNAKKKSSVDPNTPKAGGHTCSQCGVSFARAASLNLHAKTHLKSGLTSPIDCGYCDKQFQDATCLATHQIHCSKKGKRSNSDSNSMNSKSGKHPCSECGKKFMTKQKMFRHQWIHRKKTQICEVCGLQFEKQSELDEHRLAAHPGDSPFLCNECGKSFVSRQGLWEHGRTHAGSPAYFHCDICSKTFSSRQGFLIHNRTHTGERPYGCKYCWKSFRDGGTLRKHERIHTGERPHVCPICSRAFNQKVVLREHVRWVHAAGKNESEVTGPPFPCPLCETSTQDRDELCAHIVKHSDQMIADAKAKSNVAPKPKPEKKKSKATEKSKTPEKSKASEKSKAAEKKSKAKKSKIVEEVVEEIPEQVGTLLSIPEEVPSPKSQDTYLVVKGEYNEAVCIETFTAEEISNMTGNQSINVITIANSSNIKGECDTLGIINAAGNINTMRLIPITASSGETIHVLANSKQNNTLHLISQQNEDSPVVTIPNSEIDDTYENEAMEEGDHAESMDITTNSPSHNEEVLMNEEEEHAETIIVEPVYIKTENFKQEQDVDNYSDDESEELVCGICGNDFDDKNVLMEHVKIHI